MSEHSLYKNIAISVLLIAAMVVMSLITKWDKPEFRPVKLPMPSIETQFLHTLSGDRRDLVQASDYMHGRTTLTNQPGERARTFDPEFDGVGSALNDTF